MANNPMDYLKQLEQIGEQIQRTFGSQDFFKTMMPQMPDLSNLGQESGSTSPHASGLNWMNGQSQYPSVDLYETATDLVAVIEIPGLQSANDITLSIEPERLYIKGIVQHSYQNIPRNRLRISERHQGAFERNIPLPLPVLPTEVRAGYSNGLLEVSMPKDLPNADRPRGQTVHINF